MIYTQQPKKSTIIKDLSLGKFGDARTNFKALRDSKKLCNLSDKQLFAQLPGFVQQLGGDACGLSISIPLGIIHPGFLFSTAIGVGFTARHLNKIRKWRKEIKLRGLKVDYDWTKLLFVFAIGAGIRIIVFAATLGTLDLVVDAQFLAPFIPEAIRNALNSAVHISTPDGSGTIMTAHQDLLAHTNLDDFQHVSGAIESHTNEHVTGNNLPVVWDQFQDLAQPVDSQSLTNVVEHQPGLGNHSFGLEEMKVLVELNGGQAANEQLYKTVLEDPANKLSSYGVGAW